MLDKTNQYSYRQPTTKKRAKVSLVPSTCSSVIISTRCEEYSPFLFIYYTNITMLSSEPISPTEVTDEHSYIGPHIIDLYNDFYDQQMMAYDALLPLSDAYPMVDASQYDACYPLIGSLYLDPNMSAQALTYMEDPVTTMRPKNQNKTSTWPTQCQHPKHEDYAMLASANSSTVTPRRGRPPKGSKSTDIFETAQLKRLPKRLEPVVGRQEIYVCLTCLRRSDEDIEYVTSPNYIPPISGRSGRIKRTGSN